MPEEGGGGGCNRVVFMLGDWGEKGNCYRMMVSAGGNREWW